MPKLSQPKAANFFEFEDVFCKFEMLESPQIFDCFDTQSKAYSLFDCHGERVAHWCLHPEQWAKGASIAFKQFFQIMLIEEAFHFEQVHVCLSQLFQPRKFLKISRFKLGILKKLLKLSS